MWILPGKTSGSCDFLHSSQKLLWKGGAANLTLDKNPHPYPLNLSFKRSLGATQFLQLLWILGQQLQSGTYQPSVKPVTWDLSSSCSPVCTALVDTGLKPGVRQDSEGVLGEQEQKAAVPGRASSFALDLKQPARCCPYTTPGGTQHKQDKLGRCNSIGAVKINLFSSAFFTGNITKVLYRVWIPLLYHGTTGQQVCALHS